MKLPSIESLTLQEKIGQCIMFGFDALEVNDHAIELIKKYRVGNVILFARNVKTPKQVFELNQALQKLAYDELKIPLYISIDQEGGMVTRIKNDATFFPGAMTVSASNNESNAYLIGKHMGKELASLGINMNLAPVLDTNNNPHNPVIGVRSYSDNPHRVSTYGTAMVKGLQESVIATAKHFPGHGDTSVDSHLALPTIDIDEKRLHEIELVPFKKAIDEGIHAIMSSHIHFVGHTEEKRPATLSKRMLTDLLRDELGFKGLIVTDCMQMKAIQHTYSTKEGTLMALNAGANIICISHSRDLQVAAVKRLEEAYNNNELSEQTLHDRVQKILEYKEKYLSFDFDTSYEDIESIVINNTTKELMQSIVDGAVTRIKGTRPQSLQNTILFAPDAHATTIADEDHGTKSIVDAVKQSSLKLDAVKMSIKMSDDEINRLLQQAISYDYVIVCSYNANIHKNQINFIKKLQQQNTEVYVMAMRNPFDLFEIKSIQNYTCFYEYTPHSIQSLIKYLKKTLEPSGKAPIQYE